MFDAPEDRTVLRVEVSVRCGDNAGVQLTTMIDLPDWADDTVKARGRLTQVTDLLLGALPVETVRGMERQVQAVMGEVVLDAEGKLALVPKNLLDASQAQAELRKKFKFGEDGQSK